ncbi:MAG: threonylcarbamoyl-AMP synthase [Gemmatimonadetes bacterium]|nr:threonylcarbamoyl-AMP synthase [Gemmatimonadota bacterium]
MIAKLIRVDHGTPDREVVERVADLLRAGRIVAMRTDTVYGLLGSVNRPDALRRLVELKLRPVGKPFILLAADWIAVRSVTSHLTPVARRLGSRYWPGPLTLVLPGDENLPDEVTAAGPAVALRIPRDPLLAAILKATRAVVAAPSANLPGEPPVQSAGEALELFGDGIDLALDGGPPPATLASTIVDCRGAQGEILRAGPILPEPEDLVIH